MEHLPAITGVVELQKVAEIMIESGYFSGVKEVAQAAVKIMAGGEMGIPPIAAMRGIDIVNGQISIRAHLMAAMIKRSGRYDYLVQESTATLCRIAFFENGRSCGDSIFTIEEATSAGLLSKGGPWKAYPKMMLYNRAMSQGARIYCPDIFLGAIYDEGEIPTEPRVVSPDTSRAIPDMTQIKEADELDIEPETDPVKEEPNKRQLGFLCSILKDLGVRDGHKRELIAAVWPDGPTKESVSFQIETLRQSDKLTQLWMTNYLGLLAEKNGIGIDGVVTMMEKAFKKRNPLALDHAQQLDLIEALSTPETGPGAETETEPEATTVVNDVYTPGEPIDSTTITSAMWLRLAQDLVGSAQVSLTILTNWASNTWGTGTEMDLTELSDVAYKALDVMSTADLKREIAGYLGEEETEPSML